MLRRWRYREDPSGLSLLRTVQNIRKMPGLLGLKASGSVSRRKNHAVMHRMAKTYLFITQVDSEQSDFGPHASDIIICFVRPKGGL